MTMLSRVTHKLIVFRSTFSTAVEEVDVGAGHEVFLEVDNSALICWLSSWDFRPATQASPNPLIKYYYFITYLLNYNKTSSLVQIKFITED